MLVRLRIVRQVSALTYAGEPTVDPLSITISSWGAPRGVSLDQAEAAFEQVASVPVEDYEAAGRRRRQNGTMLDAMA